MPTNSLPNPVITGCVVVQNEAHLLSECLASLRAIVDRIVVVDHGSTDQSADIARECGATVIDGSLVGYEDARNLYLDAVHEGWVLVLDADERLVDTTEEGRAKLKRWLSSAGDTPNAYALPRYEYLGNGQFAEIDIVRLWKAHPSVRYARSSWHSSVVACIEKRGGVLVPVPFALHHLDVLLTDRAQWKRARARERGMRELARPEASPLLYAYMGLEYAAVEDFDQAIEHYRESVRREPLCAPTAALFTAQAYLAQKNYDLAEHWAKQALDGERVFYGCYQGHIVLAEVALMRDQLDTAWHFALLARKVRRSYASAHLNLAALSRLRGTEPPREHLIRAQRLNPWIFSDRIHVKGDKPSIFTQQYSTLSIADNPQHLAAQCGYTWTPHD